MGTERGGRGRVAREAIEATFGTEAGEYNINFFASHYLTELPPEYWRLHRGNASPDERTVLGLLVFQSAWGEGGVEYFDFTLPDNATDYVITGHLDTREYVDGVAIEG